MSEKKTIIFTSTYGYLSNPQYFSFVKELSDFKKIYLHVKDPLSVTYDEKIINEKEILKYFDEYKVLDYNLKEELLKVYKKRNSFLKKLSFKIIQPYYEYKKQLSKVLDDINPAAIISCSDMAVSDRVIVKWCKKNKKSKIILQNSFIDDIRIKKLSLNQKLRYLIFNKFLKAPLYRRQHLFGSENQSSHLLLWSEYFILDKKRKNTHFVGNSAFDKLLQKFDSKRKKSNIVTICTQPLDEIYNEKIFKEVNEFFKIAIKNIPDLIYYIKVHPREEISKYQKIFSEKEFPNIKIVKDYNLHELFKKSLMQISVSSFTIFEAITLGLPVILVNPNDEIVAYDHFREEIDIRVRKPEEIVKAIETIRSENYWELFVKKREEYLKKVLFNIDGKNSERIATKIRELTS
ncbi:MAG: hypothetical protein GPJ52_14545 [Candidatus Heimdallarchaeota archaeon]|nr:hypothetical protein [Candidatus Heimdallarchaeota archaeon]